MQLGDILYFETNKALGHESRPKYHVYISLGDWRLDGHVFLFINKSDYGSDYKILKVDYSFFELDYSFVGCGGVITYSAHELQSMSPQFKGRLSTEHIKQLYKCVQDSDRMTGHEIRFVCNSIVDSLK